MEDKIMAEKITRRDALKKMITYMAGVSTVPSLLGFTTELFSATTSDSIPTLYLDRVAEVIRGANITPAQRLKEDPYEYQREYTIYSLIRYAKFVKGKSRPQVKGSIRLIRQNRTELSLDLMRHGAFGHHQFVHIDQILSENDLSTPVQWSYQTRLAPSAQAEPLHGKVVSGTGRCTGSELLFSEQGMTRNYSLNGIPWTLNWNLLDALPRLKNYTGTFLTVDEYDLPGGTKTLFPYKKCGIQIAGTWYDLHSYVLLGNGTLPTFYWLNRHNELLFINTGMEVYALNR